MTQRDDYGKTSPPGSGQAHADQLLAAAPWQPDAATVARVDELMHRYRHEVVDCLQPAVAAHYPELLESDEYRKMLELSTKMTLVGHAACEIAGYPYDQRRQTIGTLFGGCCFLADSFIDDFGPAATQDYLERLRLLLTTGWFDVRSERERLFYTIVARLFAARDVLDPVLRQAIMLLFEAQRRDCELRLSEDFAGLTRRRQLRRANLCTRPQRSRDPGADRVRRACDRVLDSAAPVHGRSADHAYRRPRRLLRGPA